MPRRPALVLLAVLTTVLAGCGGGGGGGGSTKQAATSSPCAQGSVVIHMADINFKPEKADAKVGQTVCWVNDDDVQHDAVDEDSKQFESDLFGKGKTFSWKAAKAGTVKYECTVHPGMTGELDVSG
jgi:plastocyanin